MKLSNKEIRNKLLESDDPKGWKYSIGEQMRDNLTDDQAAMLAYYFYDGDMTTLGRYFAEIMVSTILITMRNEIEDYKDKHSINDEQDDCSAYKEHRDLNPENYK